MATTDHPTHTTRRRKVAGSFEDYLQTQAARSQPGGTACEGCYREDLACWRLHVGNPIPIAKRACATCPAMTRRRTACTRSPSAR